ncbi:hypothetical protein BH11PSE14_BH11PSE14_07400 [soil metagenome]
MLEDVQRMAVPELTRVFGQTGLYLRPNASIAAELSGNMLGTVISLQRRGRLLDGLVRCLDYQLPLCSSTLSLVYGLFALEDSAEPELLVQEIARVLQPEGTALMIGFNPWGFSRLRWRLRGARPGAHANIGRIAADAGLEVVRRQYLGPIWPSLSRGLPDPKRTRWYDGLRVAELVVLRRRDLALTPLRMSHPAVSLRPGMSAG